MDTLSKTVSLVAACIAAVLIWHYLAVGFMAISLWLVETPDEEITTEAFKESYGTLIEDLRLDKGYIRRYYYPLYLLRRTYYAIALIVLLEYPILQLILIPFLLVLPMMMYLILYLPFTGHYNNALNIYNEFVVTAVYVGVLWINIYPMRTAFIEYGGWIMISLIVASLLTTWIILIPGVLKAMWNSIVSCFKDQPKLEQKDERKEEKKASPMKPLASNLTQEITKKEEQPKTELTLGVENRKVVRKIKRKAKKKPQPPNKKEIVIINASIKEEQKSS